MDREKLVSWIDHFTLFCFCVLVIFLPIRETETIRAFSMGIPLGLWIIKMIIQRKWLIRRTPLDIPILLFTLVAAVSLITAVDFWYSADEFQGEWLTGIVLFYLVVNNFREEQLKYLLGALLLGNLLMVSYGIFDFFHHGGSLLDYRVRAGSLHSGYYTFAIYLLTTTPYILTAFFSARRAANRFTLMPLLFFNLFALYLTQTRGAWVAMGVLLSVVIWRFLPKKVLFFFVGMAVIIIFFFAPQKIMKHRTEFTTPGGQTSSIETVQARWELIKFSLEKIKENPFQMIVYGRRSFIKKYRDFYLQYKGALLWHAHNTFLDIALQTGLQGLAVFLFLLYRLLRFIYVGGETKNITLAKYYCLATFMMVISFFVGNFSDDCFIDDSALLFWFLSGAAITLKIGTEGAGSQCGIQKPFSPEFSKDHNAP